MEEEITKEDLILKAVNEGFTGVQKQINEIDSKMTTMATKDDLYALESRMELKMATKDDLKELEDRFTSKVDAFMGKTTKVEDDEKVLVGQVAGLHSRVEVLEEKVGISGKDVKQMKPVLGLS